MSPTRLSPKPRNVEFVVITDTNGKPESKENIREIVADLRRIDSEIPESEDALPNGQQTMDMFEGKDQTSVKSLEMKKNKNKPRRLLYHTPLKHLGLLYIRYDPWTIYE